MKHVAAPFLSQY